MPTRLHGELEERIEHASRMLSYHNAFLDDYLRGILPNDLILLGAPSGMGKTDLALSIAASNANKERRVAYFALEAEPRELERRTKFSLLSAIVYETNHPERSHFNYTDWLLGRCEHICGDYNRRVDQYILANLCGLHTFYRGAKFDAGDLERSIQEIHKETDLIVVDHLHYIDAADSDTNEAKSLGDTVKSIRDIALIVGKPVLLVAHLRKRDPRAKQLVTNLDDFHGSSNVVKIATQVITIEHASSIDAPKWWLAPTFVSVLKDRRAGAPRMVALVNFDKRRRCYEPHYTLGRLTKGSTEWEQVPYDEKPTWAHHHRGMTTS
jgi:hypothetical protein